jgi:hypothetical protein
MLYSNILSTMCESWLLALSVLAQVWLCLWVQRTLVMVEYAQRKISWPGEIEPKTSVLIPC